MPSSNIPIANHVDRHPSSSDIVEWALKGPPDKPYYLLIGVAGSGKSTLLQRVYVELATRSPQQCYPLYLDLQRRGRKGLNEFFADWIRAEAAPRLRQWFNIIPDPVELPFTIKPA